MERLEHILEHLSLQDILDLEDLSDLAVLFALVQAGLFAPDEFIDQHLQIPDGYQEQEETEA